MTIRAINTTHSLSLRAVASLFAAGMLTTGCALDAGYELDESGALDESPSLSTQGGWVPGGFTEAWSQSYGDADPQVGESVAVAPDGSIVVTGYFKGSVSFGGTTLTAAGSSDDAFVAKLGADGTHIWSKRFGDEGATSNYRPQKGLKVAVDGNGDIVVAGIYEGKLNLSGESKGALPDASSTDVFVARFSPSGALLWSEQLGGAGDQLLGGMTLMGDRVAVAGSAKGSLKCGAGGATTPTAGGSMDIMTAVLTMAGSVSCSLYGNGADQTAKDVVSVPPLNEETWGELIVMGEASGVVDFGGGPLTPADGNEDVFRARLRWSPGGGGTWTDMGSRLYTANAAKVTSVALYSNGDVAVTGTVWTSIDFGNGAAPGGGDNDIFAARLDEMGDGVWTKRFGGYSDEFGGDLAIDGAGNLQMVGRFKGSLNFGGGNLAASGSATDVYVAKLAPDGAHLFSHDYGIDGSNEVARGVATDSDGYTFVLGAFEDSVDFGDGPLAGAGSWDIFLTRQMF